MILDIISIVISLCALIISGYIWYSDKKSVWYWNIVLVPMQDIFKKMKSIDIKDKENIVTILNRYTRNVKDCSDFLDIGIKKKNLLDLQEYIEGQFNKIVATVFSNEDGGNYMEIISAFETQLYKRIAKLVLKK